MAVLVSRRVAVLLIILITSVVVLFAFSGLFSNIDSSYDVEKPRYTYKALSGPGSVGDQTWQMTVSRKIKDYAVDRSFDGPSSWLKRLSNGDLKHAPTLSKDDINRIEKFVFFVGYPRSGHSIVGSLMDAHPHMVIANEFMLFKSWKYFSDRHEESGEANPFYKKRNYLFNALYLRSYWDTIGGLRNEQNTRKNYTLSMDSLWQGKFDKYISVIGDKSGGGTAICYLKSKSTFARYLEELKMTVKVPIKAVHVIRNPYDQISTCTLYQDYELLPEYTQVALHESSKRVKQGGSKPALVSEYKAAMSALQAKGDNGTFDAAKYNGEKKLKKCIQSLVQKASAVVKMAELIGPSNVIDVHNADLVNDPKEAIGALCSSLEIPCSPDYLQACADKVFKSISRTRDMLVWSPEMKAKVEEEVIQTYPFFSRYSFETD